MTRIKVVLRRRWGSHADRLARNPRAIPRNTRGNETLAGGNVDERTGMSALSPLDEINLRHEPSRAARRAVH